LFLRVEAPQDELQADSESGNVRRCDERVVLGVAILFHVRQQ